MGKHKRAIEGDESQVRICNPISNEEILKRAKDYLELNESGFSQKYNDLDFKPIRINIGKKHYELQLNYCLNPWCKWYGVIQQRIPSKGKLKFIYRSSGSDSKSKRSGKRESGERTYFCNDDDNVKGITSNHSTKPLSNWSVAEEIKRLIDISTLTNKDKEYQFHKDNCDDGYSNPFDNPDRFIKRGKSKTNSKQLQCKTCKKKTSILPNKHQSYSYHKGRSEVLPRFAELLLNRVPVSRTCEILKIGRGTYYRKLEDLYLRTLEFLERHETRKLSLKKFKRIHLVTDSFMYYLNNIRKKGEEGEHIIKSEKEPYLQTYAIITGESYSRYIFRSDMAYDWNIRQFDIVSDTIRYKEDHLYDSVRKNARYRYPYFPQPPTPYDNQSKDEYLKELEDFNNRFQYVDGLHVETSYTATAHTWLLKQLLNSDEWVYVSDFDKVLINSILRVFKDEVINEKLHLFKVKLDPYKKLAEAFEEYQDGIDELLNWSSSWDKENFDIYEAAMKKLMAELDLSKFYNAKVDAFGDTYPMPTNSTLRHPIPTPDKGFVEVGFVTSMATRPVDEIAKDILSINTRATDGFMQEIRRRLSISERPLITAKTFNGRSYIYANYNPKYAHYSLTILRAYYNFCKTIRSHNGDKLTPAQRLGIADKVYNLNDIVYFK